MPKPKTAKKTQTKNCLCRPRVGWPPCQRSGNTPVAGLGILSMTSSGHSVKSLMTRGWKGPGALTSGLPRQPPGRGGSAMTQMTTNACYFEKIVYYWNSFQKIQKNNFKFSNFQIHFSINAMKSNGNACYLNFLGPKG